MGIFSLFGKKNAPPEQTKTIKSTQSKTRPKNTNPITNINEDELFSHSVVTQKHVARATALKIDDIEREMTRDLISSKPLAKKGVDAAAEATDPKKSRSDSKPKAAPQADSPVQDAPDFPSTIAMAAPPADSIMFGHTDTMMSDVPETQSVPLLEEAAILFASGQDSVAEHMLQCAIYDQTLGPAERIGWQMLFDLYLISGNASAFENLALDFARKFETSPPNWRSDADDAAADADTGGNEVTASILFPAKLHGDITKVIDKIQTAIKKNQQLRCDFSRIKELNPDGCALLLKTLQGIKKSGHGLTLVGAQELANKIRATIETGRRDDTESSWLLLLELLQLLGQQEIFEETSIDYCITFEVSPPSFEAPKNNIMTAVEDIKLEEEMTDRFLMPKIIEGNTDIIAKQIAEHAKAHNPVILDCSNLDRVEFGASAQLLSGLVPIAAKKGVLIQFHDVNFPVLMLFNAMGLKNVATIFPRKY